MQSQATLSNDQLSDEDILQLNSAYFSLRLALIFLIITVIIFVIMQIIKLICQIRKIRSKAEQPFNNKTPELVVHSNTSKRRKRSKHLLPSRDMKIQLSLRNEPETPVDRETVSKKEEKKKKELPSTQSDTRAKNIVPCNETQNFSDEFSIPGIKYPLALFDSSQDQSMSTSLSIKKKPTFSGLKAQDSLMIVNSEISLQPSQSAEKINEKTGWKENESTPLAMKIHDSDDKSAFVTAKAQDSLMVVNDLKPLQPSTSAEQTIWEKSEESKIARQKEIEL